MNLSKFPSIPDSQSHMISYLKAEDLQEYIRMYYFQMHLMLVFSCIRIRDHTIMDGAALSFCHKLTDSCLAFVAALFVDV